MIKLTNEDLHKLAVGIEMRLSYVGDNHNRNDNTFLVEEGIFEALTKLVPERITHLKKPEREI